MEIFCCNLNKSRDSGGQSQHDVCWKKHSPITRHNHSFPFLHFSKTSKGDAIHNSQHHFLNFSFPHFSPSKIVSHLRGSQDLSYLISCAQLPLQTILYIPYLYKIFTFLPFPLFHLKFIVRKPQPCLMISPSPVWWYSRNSESSTFWVVGFV